MDFIPGYLQGITRVFISHPFDYIRIYLQTNRSSSIIDFFKNHSYKNLYRGVGIPRNERAQKTTLIVHYRGLQ